MLRWCACEVGKARARASAADHACYAQVRERIDGKRAALSEARKITRPAAHLRYPCGHGAGGAALSRWGATAASPRQETVTPFPAPGGKKAGPKDSVEGNPKLMTRWPSAITATCRTIAAILGTRDSRVK